MANYGEHTPTLTDTFDTSIASGWTNGPDLWGTMAWATGGYIEPAAVTGDRRIVRNDTPCGNDQYFKITVQAGDADAAIGGTTRGTSTTTGCYLIYCIQGITDQYRILDVAENGTTSTVASGSFTTGPFSAGDTITGESDGTTHRIGTNEGAGDTERFSGIDSTWATGQPGCYINNTSSVAGSRITSVEIGDMGAAPPAATEAALTFTINQSIAQSNTAIFDASVTFANTLSDEPVNTVNYESALSIASQLSAISSAGVAFESAITAAIQLSQTQSSNQSLEAAFTAALQLTLAQTNTADYQSDISLSATLGQNQSSTAIIGVAAVFAQQLNAVLTGETLGSLDGTLSFNTNHGLQSAANGIFGAETVFNQNLSLNLSVGKEISESVTFALTQSDEYNSVVTIEGGLVLNLNQSLEQTSTAIYESNLLLNQQLILTAINQGVLNAGLSLNAIQSVNITGSSFVLGIQTVDKRIITVEADSRTLTISADDKTLTPHKANRSKTIN